MLLIRKIRKQLKLNQTELAEYLGISRSVVALVETGRATLNLDALQKLELLHNLIENLPASGSMSPDPGKQTNYELEEKELQYQVRILKRKLVDLDKCYESYNRLSRIVSALKHSATDNAAWLTKWEFKAKIKLSECSESSRNMIRDKIQKLNAEALYIRSQIEKQSGSESK